MWKLLFFAGIAAAQQSTTSPTAPPPNPRLEGKVTSQAAAVLSKAALHLRGNTQNYSAESDPSGNFVFESVEPGDYTLTVDRTGYVRGIYNTSTANQRGLFSLKPGQVKSDVLVKLIPQAVIAGKVTDRDGDPMDKARVTAYRKVLTAGRWRLQYVQTATAALDGAYQIGGLAAGKYYVSAEDSDTAMGMPPGEPGRPGHEERYVITYHPSALDASTAVAVGVGAGEELGHVDIRIRKERVYRLRGRAISSLTGGPLTRIALGIAPVQTDPAGIQADPKLKLGMAEDGGFEFGQLPAGSYVISTQGNLMLNGKLYSDVPLVARRVVNISDRNVENLVLELVPPAEITGLFRTEGSDTPPSTLNIGLVATDGLGRSNTPIVPTRSDGAFTIPAVAPNQYHVTVSNLPPGTYVQSIRFASLDVTRAPLDLTSGAGGKLDLVLSPDAADVSGTVRNENGDACAGATVTLWEPALPPAAADTTKTITADQSGGFRFQNLPPGDYRLAAWEEIDPGVAAIPEFRAHFDTTASTVKLNARDHATADLKLVKKEVIQAESARLR
jgi:hypothetical protein